MKRVFWSFPPKLFRRSNLNLEIGFRVSKSKSSFFFIFFILKNSSFSFWVPFGTTTISSELKLRFHNFWEGKLAQPKKQKKPNIKTLQTNPFHQNPNLSLARYSLSLYLSIVFVWLQRKKRGNRIEI